uniref:Uncharacterized protein n=1 Tax=Parascaris univalens TaxID=6257 RepID=A0A914ZVP1_PARUN
MIRRHYQNNDYPSFTKEHNALNFGCNTRKSQHSVQLNQRPYQGYRETCVSVVYDALTISVC